MILFLNLSNTEHSISRICSNNTNPVCSEWTHTVQGRVLENQINQISSEHCARWCTTQFTSFFFLSWPSSGSDSDRFGLEMMATEKTVYCVTVTYIWKQIFLIRRFTLTTLLNWPKSTKSFFFSKKVGIFYIWQNILALSKSGLCQTRKEMSK